MKRVGIDIGGTQLRCAIFDEDGIMIDKYKIHNDQSISAKENLDKLLEFIMRQPYRISGIGIGCPGPLNIRLGKILNPPNLKGWNNFEIVRYVENKTGLKTALNNDANVAGLSEAVLGAGKNYDSIYYITMSTGIGGAYVVNKTLVNGANSASAEIYNMIVNEDKHTHGGVNQGAINEQCGGTGLAIIAKEKFGREVSPKELFDLYYGGNPIATKIIENAIDAMAKAIANICCVVDPDVFVIGGSIAIFNPTFVDRIYEKAKEYCINPQFLYFIPASFGDDAGLIGASLLV